MSDDRPVRCRCCNSEDVAKIGALPEARRFAGAALNAPLAGGDFYICGACGLGFRHPILTPAEYAGLYREVQAAHWQSSRLRFDESFALDLFSRTLTGKSSVLDVGCFTGTVLNRLPAAVRKFGIEPSEQASEICRKNGVEIIGHSFEELGGSERRFDAVMSLDVIEHVPDPLHFLRLLASVTRRGGSILIATGDVDSLVWRSIGPSYYYSQNPEHISFISGRWCRFAADTLGLSLAQARHPVRWGEERAISAVADLSDWVTLGFKVALSRFEYLVARATAGLERSYVPRFAVGRPGLARDHVVAVFVKN